MASNKNTSYKVHVQRNTDAEIADVNIEQGAMMVSDTGLYMGYNGENVRVYPQTSIGSGLGWTRYDGGLYTADSKLSLVQDAETILPNNSAVVYRSYDGIDYYNGATSKVLADNVNDVYIMTIVFRCSAANANQTYLRLQLDSAGTTPYERLGTDIAFPKGNNVEHEFHQMFQYYADQDFTDNGSIWKITASGGTAKIWDIIYFIQKTQSYA